MLKARKSSARAGRDLEGDLATGEPSGNPDENKGLKDGRARWSIHMERALLHALLEEVQLGRRAENGFKKEAWKAAAIAVNQYSDSANPNGSFTVTQVKNKVTNLKRKYDLFVMLKGNSGFGWNEERGIPTAPDEVWDRTIEKYPGVGQFREEPLRFFELLDQLFTGTRATGLHALTPYQLLDQISMSSAHFAGEKRDREELDDEPEIYDLDTMTTTAIDSLKQLENQSPKAVATFSTTEAISNTRKKVKIETSYGSGSGKPMIRESSQISRDRTSAGKAIAREMANMTAVATQLNISKTETAIVTLQNDYDDLSIDDMVAAMSIFENEMKAKMFVAMRMGAARDAWLKREITLYSDIHINKGN